VTQAPNGRRPAPDRSRPPAAVGVLPRVTIGHLPALLGVPVPTVAVEEEFLLLRPDGRPADVAPELLGAVGPGARAVGRFSPCQVGTATGICTDLTDVRRQLSAARQVVARAAADRGAALVAVGTPPGGAPGPADPTGENRHRRSVDSAVRATGEETTCAARVHVSVGSRDLGAAVLGRLRPWLPVLLALAANSPLWRGADTGWSSQRFAVQRRWPSFVPPPECPDAAAYDERVAELIRTRAALDEPGVHFWARLSPRHPAVEIRIGDTCLTVDDAVLLAGLCRALVMTVLADELIGGPAPTAPDRFLRAAAYATARHGLSSVVLDPGRGGWAPAAALLRRMMVAVGPALEVAGDRAVVEALLAERLRRGSGADRQRALWHGGTRAGFVRAVADLAFAPDTA
jgi:glutamate---cysteine ligase / carboxylate-amine ligase